MNNIEKDKKYKKWPKQLQQLLQHAWQLIPIRRNLYTAVFVIDPLTKLGLETIGVLYDLMDGNIPLRMGIVMVDSVDNKQKEINAGTVLKLLATAKKEHKQAADNGFLKVLSQLSEKVPLLKEDLITAYATGVAQGTGSWSSSSFSEEAVKCLESDRFDTLAGKVLKIGGLKEKLIAAKRSGITNVIVPHENLGDVEEIESNILKDLNIISVKNITEVLKEALV